MALSPVLTGVVSGKKNEITGGLTTVMTREGQFVDFAPWLSVTVRYTVNVPGVLKKAVAS
jgi:hypothetical protein